MRWEKNEGRKRFYSRPSWKPIYRVAFSKRTFSLTREHELCTRCRFANYRSVLQLRTECIHRQMVAYLALYPRKRNRKHRVFFWLAVFPAFSASFDDSRCTLCLLALLRNKNQVYYSSGVGVFFFPLAFLFANSFAFSRRFCNVLMLVSCMYTCTFKILRIVRRES